MVVDNASRFGFVVTTSLALMACGSSTKSSMDAKDSRSALADVGPDLDLPADSSPLYKDGAVDAGFVTIDGGPDSPLLSRDSVSPETAPISNDAGLDGIGVRKDTALDVAALDVAALDVAALDVAALDVAALDVAADIGYDGSTVATDGGRVDVGLALLTINPGDGYFDGLVWPIPPIAFTVSNVGAGPSGTFTVTISGYAGATRYYKITSNSCDRPLPAGESCQVTVAFTAPGGAGGPYTASLNIVADGIPGGRFTIQLSGEVP